MSERQSWLVLPLEGELLQVVENLGELGDEKIESIAHEDELRVVGDVAARRAVVDDTSRSGGSLAKSMNVLYLNQPRKSCRCTVVLTAMTSWYASQLAYPQHLISALT